MLLSSTAAAMTADYDARGAQRADAQRADATPSRGGRRGRPDQRAGQPPVPHAAGHPSRPGEASPVTSPAARHPELTRHAARPPRQEQPRLPYGEPMSTLQDGPKVVALTIDDGPSPVYTPQILRILRR